MSMSSDNFYVLCQKLGALCTKNNIRLALAESCTGGGVAKYITDVPGSSQWFLGSAVVYSNAAKINILQVDAALLKKQGAVSEPVAMAMAKGARHIFQAEIALAITGIAGPGGGTIEKPVGTVCFALDHHSNNTGIVKTKYFVSGRDYIRQSAVRFALEWMIASF